jgi:superfamily II DNA or RNA helicase
MVKKIALAETGRRLILVERLAQGDAIAALLPGACWIQGRDDIDVRKQVIERLKSADSIIAIVSQKLMSKGLDVKIHCLINAAGGAAIHSTIQRCGRGLRTAKDKDILRYYDFLFNINNYLRDHSEKRIKTLKEEGHTIVIKEEFDL